jgi:hypothetical protein
MSACLWLHQLLCQQLRIKCKAWRLTTAGAAGAGQGAATGPAAELAARATGRVAAAGQEQQQHTASLQQQQQRQQMLLQGMPASCSSVRQLQADELSGVSLQGSLQFVGKMQDPASWLAAVCQVPA